MTKDNNNNNRIYTLDQIADFFIQEDWITKNLETRGEWSLEDYKEFYNKDVPYLLAFLQFCHDQYVELRRKYD